MIIRYKCRKPSPKEGLTNHKEKLVFSDIDGAQPFRIRPQASEMLEVIRGGNVKEVVVESIGHLGKNNFNILTTLKIFKHHNVNISIENLGISTLLNNVDDNPIFGLIQTALNDISTMEKISMVQRQADTISIALETGESVYRGRIKGTSEAPEEFLAKYPQVVELLQSNTPPSLRKIAVMAQTTLPTVQKVKRVLKEIE